MVFELFSEGSLLLLIQDNLRCDFLTSILVPFTHSGDIGIIWGVTGLFFLLFKPTRKSAFLALISFSLSFLLSDYFLKLIINRTRPFDVIPNLIALVERPNGSSFPSGHTSTAMGFSICYLINLKRKWTGWIVLFFGLLMGFSRLYVGVHYPSDVCGGILLGTLISLTVTFSANYIISKKQTPSKEE